MNDNMSKQERDEMLDKIKRLFSEIMPEEAANINRIVDEGASAYEWLNAAGERLPESVTFMKRAKIASEYTLMQLDYKPDRDVVAVMMMAFGLGMLAERDGWCIEDGDHD
jgi:hypothetical protein